MEYMINALVLVCALECGNVLGCLHHADSGGVTHIIAAYGAHTRIGKIAADTALLYCAVGIDYSVCKGLCVLVAHAHYKISQPLCGFHANARKLCELLRKEHQRQCCAVCHCKCSFR